MEHREYHLFISYRHSHSEPVKALVQALNAEGLSVWHDEAENTSFQAITHNIRDGLAKSRAFLAFYSKDYPDSRPCQWELTAAFIAAQKKGEVNQRLLVINPESDGEHIHPIELRDAVYASVPEGEDEVVRLAGEIKSHIQPIDGTFAAIHPLQPPHWFGTAGIGSNRFVGRVEQMWLTHSGLTAGDAAIITAANGANLARLQGGGGFGKSLLAEEYAMRFAAAYPGGIFWLRAFGHDDAGAGLKPKEREAMRLEQLGNFAAHLDIAPEQRKPEEVEGALARHLEGAGKPFLWVVDDLPPGLDNTTLRSWFAPHGLGSTLITTRSREYNGQGQTIDVGVLKPDEALALLTRLRPPANDTEREAAVAITLALGYHALAVDVAGGVMDDYSYREFLDEIKNPNKDALALVARLGAELPNDHDKSIAATLLHSIKRLNEPGLDLLRLAAQTLTAPIPKGLLFDAFAELDGLEGEEASERGRLALSETRKHSLIEDEERGAAFSVHTLISRTLRFYDDADERQGQLYEGLIAALNQKLPAVTDIRNHNELEAYMVHARELTTEVANAAEAVLLGWVARHDQERGLYAVAEQNYRRQWEVLSRTLGEEHHDTLTTMSNLAETLRSQGDLSGARVLQKQVLEALRRTLDEEHPDTLSSMNNLAAILCNQGDLSGSRALQEQVLEAQRRTLGEEHPNTLRSMNNLAGTLGAQGDLSGARVLQEQVLEARRRTLGEEHPDTLSGMGNLAGTLGAQGDLSGARVLEEQVLEARRRTLGEEHPDTLSSMNNLALTLCNQGDLSGARALEEQVLEARRRTLGEEHPDTLGSMNNLASTLWSQGGLSGARVLQEQVLEARRRTLGEDHPDTLNSMNNLASTLWIQSDLSGARVLEEQLLEAQRRTLGEEHPETLTSMNNLAETLRSQGDLSGARVLQKQVLEALRRTLDEEHPDTLSSMNNLASTLCDQGDLSGARVLQEQVLEVSRRTLGEKHSSTTISAWNLFMSVRQLDDAPAAEELFARSLQWLLAEDATELCADQQTIRGHLMAMKRSAKNSDSNNKETP